MGLVISVQNKTGEMAEYLTNTIKSTGYSAGKSFLLIRVVKQNMYRRFAGKHMGINFTGSRYCICSASSHFLNILDRNEI